MTFDDAVLVFPFTSTAQRSDECRGGTPVGSLQPDGVFADVWDAPTTTAPVVVNTGGNPAPVVLAARPSEESGASTHRKGIAPAINAKS